jgi:hypothetical protein
VKKQHVARLTSYLAGYHPTVTPTSIFNGSHGGEETMKKTSMIVVAAGENLNHPNPLELIRRLRDEEA